MQAPGRDRRVARALVPVRHRNPQRETLFCPPIVYLVGSDSFFLSAGRQYSQKRFERGSEHGEVQRERIR